MIGILRRSGSAEKELRAKGVYFCSRGYAKKQCLLWKGCKVYFVHFNRRSAVEMIHGTVLCSRRCIRTAQDYL